MNTKLLTLPAAALLGLSSLSAQAVPTLFLNEYGINIDGDYIYDSAPLPTPTSVVDMSLFDGVVGTISATITGMGHHSFDAYFDHDFGLDWSNETGVTKYGATAATGQSWEIDEPGYISGDIVDNFEASTLDNSIGLLIPEDVSMAMGWDFDLLAGETAVVTVLLSEEKPDADFFLKQINWGGLSGNNHWMNGKLYLSSALDITGTVPEPSMFLLLGVGAVGMVVTRRKVKV